jgi:hypothetical protein
LGFVAAAVAPRRTAEDNRGLAGRGCVVVTVGIGAKAAVALALTDMSRNVSSIVLISFAVVRAFRVG